MQSDFFKYFLFGVAALLVFMLLRQWNSFSSEYEKQISPSKNSVNEEVYSVEENFSVALMLKIKIFCRMLPTLTKTSKKQTTT